MEDPMPPRIRLLFLGLSVTLFFIAAVPLFRELSRRPDIWWTPATMLVPLAEGKDRVQIYARGRPVEELLAAGQLRLVEEGGSTVLASSDLGLRFNNFDRVRAQTLPLLLVSTAACGVAALLFLLFLTGRLAYRGEQPA
jgi:hypothetical protein